MIFESDEHRYLLLPKVQIVNLSDRHVELTARLRLGNRRYKDPRSPGSLAGFSALSTVKAAKEFQFFQVESSLKGAEPYAAEFSAGATTQLSCPIAIDADRLVRGWTAFEIPTNKLTTVQLGPRYRRVGSWDVTLRDEITALELTERIHFVFNQGRVWICELGPTGTPRITDVIH